MTPSLRQRVRAVAGDGLIVLGWAAVAAVVGVLLRTAGSEPTTPGAWDAVAFATLVLPVVGTHAVLETRHGATPGKRWVGLAVLGPDGGRPAPAVAAVRSAVKFAPWQLAHSAVFRMVAGSQEVVWLWLATSAQVVVLGSAVMVAARQDGRALHDLVAGTRVAAGRAGHSADSGGRAPTA